MGESIVVQRGRRRENVAILAPFKSPRASRRPLGLLSARGKPAFKDWTMHEDEFLASRWTMAWMLDTHALIWALFEPEKLGSTARGILGDSRNEVMVSPLS